jgi:toxin secretion/phage lysis holin
MTVLMQYLLACNVLDIVTGFIKAYDAKNVSSKKMKHGALSKVSIWCVVCLAIMVSTYLKTDLTSYVVGYYLLMEGVSILENVSQFIPIPDKLKGVLDTNQVVEKPKVDKVTNVTPEIVQYIKEMEGKKNG